MTFLIVYSSGVQWTFTGSLLAAKRIATKFQTVEAFGQLANIEIYNSTTNELVATKEQYNWIKN